MQIHYSLYFNATGYSCSAVDYIKSIQKVNPERTIKTFAINGIKPHKGISKETYDWFNKLYQTGSEANYISIQHCIPSIYISDNAKKRIGIAVYETIDPPFNWIKRMNEMDHIVTASTFNKCIFESAGLKVPVTVIPHCFDPVLFNQNVSPKGRYNLFTFMYIASWRQRKNFSTLIKAFYDAFSTKDHVCLLLKTDKPQTLKSTITSIKNDSWRTKNTAPIYMEENIIPFEEIPALMKKADVYISSSLGEGFGLCFKTGTKILTDIGYKKIEDIVIGEKVFNSEGNLTEVINKTSRKTRIDENIINICIQGHNTLRVTPDHEILTCDYRYNNKKKLCGFSWKKAKELKEYQYVFIPRIKLDFEIPKNIDVTKLISCIYDEKNVWKKMGYSPKTKHSIPNICGLMDCTKRQVENARRFIRKQNISCSDKVKKIVEFMCKEDIALPSPKKCPRYIDIDDDFLYFAGWYIAEGSSDDNKIELSLGKKDTQYIDRLMKYMFRLNLDPNIISFGNSIRIIGCGAICGIFRKLFGQHAENKQIPEFLLKSDPRIISLLKGYFLGNGYFISKKNRLISCVTKSSLLSEQLYMLLNSFGIWSDTFNSNYGAAYTVAITGKFASLMRTLLKWDEPVFTRRACNRVFSVPGGFIIPIKKIIKEKYNDEVWDITVDSDDHSFIADGMIAHNSGLHSMALNIPVITVKYGGCLEYAKPEFCTYINPHGYKKHIQMDGLPQFKNKIWPEIKISEVKDKMLFAYNSHEVLREKSKAAYEYAHTNYNYDIVGRRFVSLLKELENAL